MEHKEIETRFQEFRARMTAETVMTGAAVYWHLKRGGTVREKLGTISTDWKAGARDRAFYAWAMTPVYLMSHLLNRRAFGTRLELL